MLSGSGAARRALALLTIVVVPIVLNLPVSSQGKSQERGRTWINGREAAANEVLVKYKDLSVQAQNDHLDILVQADENVAVDRRGMRRVYSRKHDTAQMLALLRKDPDIAFAEPNYVLYAQRTPNEPLFTYLWGLSNSGSNPVGGGGTIGADIDAVTAWDTTIGTRANVVGIIDTGVDYLHPDLAANMWSAPSAFQVSINGQTITCQAGTHGFNAINKTCDPMDDNNHGTHVAGTIGGRGNNGFGVAGVNWVANMMGLKFLGASGSGMTSDAISAIDFAVQAKAAFAATGEADVRILSNSWGGGGFSQALLDAINSSSANGMLFVAAAGNNNSNNDSSPHYPSSYAASNIVSVASTTSSDVRSSFSNYGATSVHVAAPGSSIYSTIRNNSYASFNGTSMATPHVSGAAALALSVCMLTTSELKSLILNNVDVVPALSSVVSTGGRLNVARMIQNCPHARVSDVTLTPSVASPQAANTAITWTAAATGGESPYEYRFMVFNGTSWSGGSWSTENTFVWTPTTANSGYKVQVRVRSAGNSGAAEAFSPVQSYVIQQRVTGLTLTPNLTAPQGTGTAIVFTAAASGGTAPYQYKFTLSDGSATSVLGVWSSSNTVPWTPTVANDDYVVTVHARSSGNTSTVEMATNQAFAIKPSITSLTMSPSVTAPQAPNTTITWTATAMGGEAPRQYRFMVFDGTTWTGGSWTTSNTFAWTPTTSNANYQVQVRARSAWNSGVAEALSTAQAFPIQPRVTGVTLTPNLTAPQGTGTTITWTATASGGVGPLQYKWTLSDGTTSTVLGVWGSSNTLAWTPTAADDDYVLTVHTRSAGNTTTVEQAVNQAFAIKPAITSVTISPSASAPQTPNTTITWTANATGGTGPREYRFMVFDGTAWTGGSWSTSNTFAWTPTTSNANYQVQVRARSAWNAGVAEALSTATPFPIQARITNLTLTPSAASPQGAGTAITLTASATGGVAPYQYKFTLYDGVSTTVLGVWGSTNTVTWTPATPNASYVVIVHARSSGNTATVEQATPLNYVIKPVVTSVTMSPDISAPRAPNTTITWTATPTGGEGPIQYRWMVFNGTTWTGGSWTTSDTFAWTPTTANSNYQVQVRARSAWSNGVAEAQSTAQGYPIQ